MKTSIATVSISGALETKLQAVAAAGFDGAEVFENDLLSSHLSARQIGALMADLGLVCTLFQPFRDLEGLPDPQRQRAFERPGMTDEKLTAILAKQMPDADKRRRADFVVDTSQGFDHARAQVRDILRRVSTMPLRRR